MHSPILITGATGLLGQAFMRRIALLGIECVGVARSGADVCLDLTDSDETGRVLDRIAPGAIVNTAALVDLAECEKEPETARRINAEIPRTLARYAAKADIPFVQISTDHFFTGDGDTLHDEAAEVDLVNEYARSKRMGEEAALEHSGSLVVRTNITGWRSWKDRPTFWEWAVGSLRHRRPMTLFTDYHTSTIDADGCARIVLDLLEKGRAGIHNVGSRDCLSKRDFIHLVAAELGIVLDWDEAGSVLSLAPRRAESCGLDVGLVENILRRRLPTAQEVVRTLLNHESAS